MVRRISSGTIIFAIISIGIVLMFVMRIYGGSHGIEAGIIEGFLHGDTEHSEAIINSIIANTELKELPDKSKMSLSALEGDLLGDSAPEVVLTLQTGEKRTVVVVYERRAARYEFVDVIDRFFSIKNEQIIELGEGEKGILLVREYANQIAGALEEAVFVRGYRWDDGFKLVLNINEEHKSYWNELWDNKKLPSEAKWLKITQRGSMELRLSDKKTPVISVVLQQSYAESEACGSVTIPDDGEFNVIKARELKHEYTWSDEWEHFILGEGTYLDEDAAILEDMSDSAYALTGNENNSYRVKRKDGSITVVDKLLVQAAPL